MRLLQRTDSLHGSIFHPLALSSQTFSSPEDCMQLIKKHTTTASQIYIESDGHRVLVNKDELAVVARLWSVCNNCTVAENCKYQTDLYGRAYTPKMRRRKPNTKQTRHALAVHKSDWDEDIHGDRFLFDSTYEQNEHIVPWRIRDADERFGFYV